MLNDADHRAHHALEVPPDLDGLRLDQALAQLLPQYSRSALKAWIDAGAATLNAGPARPRTRVHGGDAVTLTATLAPDDTLAPQPVAFRVAHEDAACLVVDKPAGVVVHPGAGNRDQTLVNGLLARYPELAVLPRAGLVHRIDKDTSGLLLVARTPAAFQVLVRAMAARAIARTYTAVVTGVPIAGGTIDAAIGRDPNQRTRMRISESGRTAVTHYRVLARYRAHALLEVSLETGRTHQIRVHMAAAGFPLVGDTRYGARPRPPRGAEATLRELLQGFPRQALHAGHLRFAHPDDDTVIEVTSPLPADLRSLVEALAADAAAHA